MAAQSYSTARLDLSVPNANDTQIGLRYISQNIDKIEYSRFSHKPFALYSVLPQLTAALDRQHTLGTIT